MYKSDDSKNSGNSFLYCVRIESPLPRETEVLLCKYSVQGGDKPGHSPPLPSLPPAPIPSPRNKEDRRPCFHWLCLPGDESYWSGPETGTGEFRTTLPLIASGKDQLASEKHGRLVEPDRIVIADFLLKPIGERIAPRSK